MSGTAPSVALHRGFLTWRGGRYAWIALGISALAISAYALDQPGVPRNGGTLLGYFLGSAGVALILWLSWFGIRRRRYGDEEPLEGVLSAHVYLGLALLVLATLHAGFRINANIHGLAWLVMALVIASGAFGAFAFWRYPAVMTAHRGGDTLSTMAAALAANDSRCADLALDLPDELAAVVRKAAELRAERNGRPLPADAADARRALSALENALHGLQGIPPASLLALSQVLTARLALIEKLQRDRHYRRLLLLWRAVHVPLTFALLTALAIHVIVVFYDW